MTQGYIYLGIRMIIATENRDDINGMPRGIGLKDDAIAPNS